MVVTSDVFNYFSINSLWELLSRDFKTFFGNAYGEVDPYNGAIAARVCVVRREKQLSVAATLVLFSAMSIRKIHNTPKSNSKPAWCPCCCLYSLPSLESVLYC